MAAPAWRVEFDRAAARDLRKLGIEAERRGPLASDEEVEAFWKRRGLP
jgi:hypothetical protein